MKKRILSLALVVVMVALVATGSLAYFTATDNATNVMTVGTVTIQQNEYERNGEGGLQAFTQNKKVLPAVLYNEEGTMIAADRWLTDYSYFKYNDPVYAGNVVSFYMPNTTNLRNFVDKIVTVKNTGDSDIWARTLIFVSDTEGEVYWNNLNFATDSECTREWLYGDSRVKIGDTYYFVIELTYNAKIAAGAESVPSLMGFYANPGMDQDDIGDGFEIVAISQAVQADGFDSAKVALDTAFGDVTAANCTTWLQAVK